MKKEQPQEFQVKIEEKEGSLQLTKRNYEYIFQVRKALLKAGYLEEKVEKILSELTSQLLAVQSKGQTARQLFGTISECVSNLQEHEEVVVKNDHPFWMWLDNSLLMFGLLSAMTLLTTFFVKSNGVKGQGIVTLLGMAISGGLVFLLMYQFFYKYQKPGADRSKKPKWWISVLVILVAMAAWLLILSLTAFLPVQLNPDLPKEVMLVITAFSIAGWWIFHKRFNMESSFMPAQRRE